MNKKSWFLLIFCCIYARTIQSCAPHPHEHGGIHVHVHVPIFNDNDQNMDGHFDQQGTQGASAAHADSHHTEVPVNNESHHASAHRSHHESRQQQSQDQRQEQKQKQQQEQTQNQTQQQSIQTEPPAAQANTLATVWRHKLFITAAIYGGLVGSLAYARALFRATSAWSRWHAEIPLHRLQAMPPDKLIDKLVTEMQRRYLNPHNPFDYHYPLSAFVRDTTRELQLLTWYITVATIATRCWLGPFFWTGHGRIMQAKKQRERLQFLSNIFKQWVAQQRTTVGNSLVRCRQTV